MRRSFTILGVFGLWASFGAGCGDGSGDGEGEADSTTGGPTSSESGEGGETGATGETGETGGEMLCNGHAELCARPYDEVAFPGTHNANASTSYGYGALNANHDRTLSEQLQDGVRLMLLDVTYEGGETMLCHGPCSLGMTPHIDGLAEIENFLAANPNEVFTIIYQDSISVDDMVADFETSGMIDRVYAHEAGTAWPTLGEMIMSGQRVVVTAEALGPPPAWYHHVWDVAWDTGYSWYSTDEMNCDLNRGALDNDLFLVNHWVSTQLDTPDKSKAADTNAYETLVARLEACQTERGHIPNFVAVDWYHIGDLFRAVDHINGVGE